MVEVEEAKIDEDTLFCMHTFWRKKPWVYGEEIFKKRTY